MISNVSLGLPLETATGSHNEQIDNTDDQALKPSIREGGRMEMGIDVLNGGMEDDEEREWQKGKQRTDRGRVNKEGGRGARN